ncbi:hypothetical protein FZEAL_8592 [Fusarium zealandicum]|uniref:Ankyrin repeat protein n=1 Tax=Fusarium zealandicum TaxID=1053134 RepID=A0A8H4UDX3_9HYPO|nr:hypothetical protein FZEAL_8592 [Fusarium zealandicum]
MTSNFESLPLELFEPIIFNMGPIALASLRQGNKSLNQTLGPYMFSNRKAVNQLMRWGCVHGEIWAIQKALSLGADPSMVEIPIKGEDYGGRASTPVQTPTLCLAARRYHYQVTEFLLLFGAQLDLNGVHHYQIKALRQRLFDCQRPELLLLYLEYGLRDMIPRFQDGIDDALRSSVKACLGLENHRIWLSLGANPIAPGGKCKREPESALSLAILSGSIPVARLLLSLTINWNISAQRLPYTSQTAMNKPSNRPWLAVPMLAAAYRMATHGTTDMMELLLKAGADINVVVGGYWEQSYAMILRLTSPLLTYAFAIDFAAETVPGKLTPHRGFKYLLKKGAELQLRDPEGSLTVWSSISVLHRIWSKANDRDRLLDKRLYGVLRLLIANGGANGMTLSFMLPLSDMRGAPCPWANKPDPTCDKAFQIAMARWRSLLDLLLQHHDYRKCSIHEMLFKFILRLNNLLGDSCFTTNSEYRLDVDATQPITIQQLLDRGANLNHRAQIRYKTFSGNILCHLTFKRNWFHPSELHCYYGANKCQRQLSLVSMLVSLGADPPAISLSRTRFRDVRSVLPWEKPGLARDPHVMEQLHALNGHVDDEDRLSWNPTAGFLLDGPWATAWRTELAAKDPRVATHDWRYYGPVSSARMVAGSGR